MLSPRIREGETFRMTIESAGKEFVFEGFLTSSEITMENDLEHDFLFDYAPVRRSTTVSLEIQTIGTVTWQKIPKKKKAAKGVQ